MPLYDVTATLHEGMMIFPGDPPFTLSPVFQMEKGEDFNLSVLSMGTHTGTHIDPPSHYFPGGLTADLIPPDVLIGPGTVLDLRGKDRIDRQNLESCEIRDCTRVLFKTDNSSIHATRHFHENYVCLTEDGAEFLVSLGIVMVGIDCLSIERFDGPGAPVHRTLLRAGVVVVEGLELAEVPVGPCRIYCLPLKILGSDGAPARVILETDF